MRSNRLTLDRLGQYHGRATRVPDYGFANIDAALEKRTIFDADPGSGKVANHRSLTTDVNAIRGNHVAPNLPQNHDFAGRDVSGDKPFGTYSDAISAKPDVTFGSPFDYQRIVTGNLTADN